MTCSARAQWKSWRVGYPPWYCGLVQEGWTPTTVTRVDGPAIIYKAGNCRWITHIAKIQNEGAVVEDNKK